MSIWGYLTFAGPGGAVSRQAHAAAAGMHCCCPSMCQQAGHLEACLLAGCCICLASLLPAAGISGGLVRFSVGLTGSQAQVCPSSGPAQHTHRIGALLAGTCSKANCVHLDVFFAACQPLPPAHMRLRLYMLVQRWEQLEESYRHVAGVPLDVKPAFKALQVGWCILRVLMGRQGMVVKGCAVRLARRRRRAWGQLGWRLGWAGGMGRRHPRLTPAACQWHASCRRYVRFGGC